MIDVFDWIHNDNKQGRKGEKISAMWSTDSGDTWSDPVVFDSLAGAVPFDTDPDGAPCSEQLGNKNAPYICRLRTGDGVADIALDMNNGTAYVVWQNGGPNGKVQIRLAKSNDHGQTWTQMGVVNGVPSTDAHTPSVAVDETGTVEGRESARGTAPCREMKITSEADVRVSSTAFTVKADTDVGCRRRSAAEVRAVDTETARR